MLSHPISAIPLFGTVTLERAAYFGVRACFVFHITSESVKMTEIEAFGFLGQISGILLIATILGGLLGLINQPRLITIIGLGIQFLGALTLAYSDHKTNLFLGYGAVVFGAGITKSNVYALLAQIYNRSKLIDSGTVISYVAVNIGAFVGVWFISLIGEENGFKLAFLTSAGLLALAIGLVIMAKSKNPETAPISVISTYNPAYVIAVMALALVGTMAFWFYIEAISPQLVNIELESQAVSQFSGGLDGYTNFWVLMSAGTLLALLYSFKRVSTSLQLAFGFLAAALCFYTLTLLSGHASTPNQSTGVILLTYYILQAIAEIIVMSALNAYALRKIDVRFIPLAMAGIYAVSIYGFQFFGVEPPASFYTILEWGVWTMLTLALVFSILFFLIKNEKTNQKTEQSTIYQDDDVLV